MFTVMFINILSLPSMSKSSNFAAVIAGRRAQAAHAHCRNIYFTTFSYQLQTFKSKEYIQNCAFLTIWFIMMTSLGSCCFFKICQTLGVRIFIIGGHYVVIGMVHRPLTMPHEKSSEVPQFVFKSQISFKL